MRICLGLLLWLGMSTTLVAQIGGGALVGRVVDQAGARQAQFGRAERYG